MDNNLKKVILLIGDVIVLYFSLYLTLLIRYFSIPNEQLWRDHFWPFTLIFAIWILIFYIASLYDLKSAVNGTKFFQLLMKILLIAGSIAVAFFYLNQSIKIAPKINLFIFLAVFTVLFFFWRQIFNLVLKTYLPKNNIGVIGFNDQLLELIKELKNKPTLGYNIAFIINDKILNIDSFENIPIVNGYDNLKGIITKNKVSTIVLTSDPHQSSELRSSLFACLPLQINFISLPNFYETATGKVPVAAISQMWFLENLSEGSKKWFDLFKRGYDILLSLIILLITCMFWPIIGFIIKKESKGDVFFIQTRLGKNGKPFRIYKFRTMTNSNNDHSPTITNDARITRFGNFLRKTRIDEIPQVLNILKGNMSFVGPRPERPELVAELEKQIPFYKERMLVNPGVTGWDQISGEYHSPSYEDTLKKLQYDLFYIKNRSIYLDLAIILKTIRTILSRSGV
jgi:exopolysaccharide biosynthesis polyprenyl glycosylphosphotransferase